MKLEHSKPTLTVFTDVSLRPVEETAGWGGWARGDERDSIHHGGPLAYTLHSAVGELWALANMLEYLTKVGYIREEDRALSLQLDNAEALSALAISLQRAHITGDRTPLVIRKKLPKGDLVLPVQKITRLVDFASVVYLKHVRGHQKGVDARSWVNELCDKRAKAEARKQIKEKEL
jgi:ribonuclease HI